MNYSTQYISDEMLRRPLTKVQLFTVLTAKKGKRVKNFDSFKDHTFLQVRHLVQWDIVFK